MDDHRTILLVEDNGDDELLTLRALKRETQDEIVVVRDGNAALHYLFRADALAPLPRLVLLDLALPGMRGLEVLRRIRAGKRTKWIPIVIMTAARDEAGVRAAYEAGANSYIAKAVDFGQFAAAIKVLCAVWLGINVVPREPAA